jgi:hypothetical protein
MSTDTFTLAPTVLVRMEADGNFGVVTVPAGEDEDEALMVFRGPEDAWDYQRTSGKHTAEEGFEVIGLGDTALAAMLEKTGISWVVMPEPWTDDMTGGSHLFTRERFFGLLEAARVVDEAEPREPE